MGVKEAGIHDCGQPEFRSAPYTYSANGAFVIRRRWINDPAMAGHGLLGAYAVIPAEPVPVKTGSENPRLWATGISLCALHL